MSYFAQFAEPPKEAEEKAPTLSEAEKEFLIKAKNDIETLQKQMRSLKEILAKDNRYNGADPSSIIKFCTPLMDELNEASSTLVCEYPSCNKLSCLYSSSIKRRINGKQKNFEGYVCLLHAINGPRPRTSRHESVKKRKPNDSENGKEDVSEEE